MPDVSIIILTYNNLREATIPCLESICRETESSDYEIVVVDNGSTDGTQRFLSDWSAGDSRRKCILNAGNRGFAGGNNDGAKAAAGEYLVFLNNDTVVTSGWLEGLLTPMRSDPSVGLVGPVTNAIGNEQKIHTRENRPEEILAESREWVSSSRGDTFETERLIFFCVAMRRNLFREIGPFDESFGTGFYEDDDYCIRARSAGYRLLCVEDVFVYHRGSASFDRMPKTTRRLLKRNRSLIRRKHGLRYRPRHPRDRQMDLVESYLEQFETEPDPRLLRKVANRLLLLEALRPKGILKRIRYDRRLSGIRARLGSPGRKGP